MSQVTDPKVTKKPTAMGLGATLIVSLAATVLLAAIAAMVFFSFSGAPSKLGGYVIVGPECESQAATRVEIAYQAARSKSTGAAVLEFAGVKFYRNVPWGKQEQNAPIPR